jgi:creatinine amidohydrolase
MALHLEQMTADELKQLNRDRTLIFIPVAALEDFGPHLPLAHGLNEATYFCEQTAVNFEGKYQGWNCVIAPRAPIGISTQTTEVSLVSRGHVLRDWLVDFCLQLNRVGFSYFVCVTGSLTPRQLTAIDDAAKQISRRARYRLIKTRPKLLSASTVQLQKSEVYRSPFWPDAWEHGGELDTSVALAIDPNEVRPIYSELKQIVRPVGFFERLLLRVRGKRSGYWGAPQMATQKKRCRTH